jgi:hypothetical protein
MGRATAQILFARRQSDIGPAAPDSWHLTPTLGWLESLRLAADWDVFDAELAAVRTYMPEFTRADRALLDEKLLALELDRLHTEGSLSSLALALIRLRTLPPLIHNTTAANLRAATGHISRKLAAVAMARGDVPRERYYARLAYHLRRDTSAFEADRPEVSHLRGLRERVLVWPSAPIPRASNRLLEGPAQLASGDDWRWAFHAADILSFSTHLEASAAEVLLDQLDGGCPGRRGTSVTAVRL